MQSNCHVYVYLVLYYVMMHHIIEPEYILKHDIHTHTHIYMYVCNPLVMFASILCYIML